MADEQTIYLSPEDELTSVLERLSSIQARRIILVIPQQTLLRSHVGWRLIHARMREQKKELWVISTDRKIRAVASAAGFKVAEAQESPSNRPRSAGGTRPGATNTRGGGRSRVGGSRAGGPESQSPSRRQFTPNASNRPLTRPTTPGGSRAEYEDESTLERPQRLERESGSGQASPAMFMEEAEQRINPSYNFRISTTPSVRPSVPQIEEDDEDDLDFGDYHKDYNTAQTIRKAAIEGDDLLPNRQEPEGPISNWGDPYASLEDDQQLAPLPEQRGSAPGPQEDEVHDIADMSTEIMSSEIEDLGDQGPIAMPEIRNARRPGASPREQGGWRPKSGQIVPPPPQRGSPRAPRPGLDDWDEDDEPLPQIPPRGFSRSQRPSTGLAGTNQRPPQGPKPGQSQRPSQGLKTGQSQRPSQALKPGQGQRASQGLKPGQSQRPSQALPQGRSQRPSQALKPESPLRPSQGLNAGQNQRPSQGLNAGQNQRPSQGLRPGQSQRPSQALVYSSRGAQPASGSPKTRTGPSANPQRVRQPIAQSRQPSAPPQRRRGNRGLAIAFVVLVLLLLTGGILFYAVPSATITVSLQAKSLSQAVKFTATTDPQANVQNKVLASYVEQNFSTSGEGNATGTTQVGNAKAQGSVSFTNDSGINLIIPTGTIVQTQSGIQFVTDAEAVAPAHDTLLYVPVVALQSGESGNVDAGTITIIPQASLSSIIKRNNLKPTDVTNATLTVTNSAPTTRGGATTQHAVTEKDLQDLKQALHLKLQQAVKTWLKQQTQNGDLPGKLIPDINASETPLAEEKLTGAPAVNQAEPNGKFSGSLLLNVKILIARAKDLQAAAGTQLNEAAQKLHPVSTLATQLPITFTNVKSTPSKDGTSLAITATASGQIIPQLDLAALSNSLTSKGLDQAQETLRTGPMAQVGVKNVDIHISPGFLSFLPLRASQIQIILRPIAATPPKNVSNS